MKRQACSKCGTGMRLFGVEPDAPGRELLSFECTACQHIEARARTVGQARISGYLNTRTASGLDDAIALSSNPFPLKSHVKH